ncbi:DDE-type integrase/transposase/recombinase [Urechidicola croceus]|uniref:DDE-type integrase/transposase/recombinase n=1 Tax=Urechidicola croceus TaxID=1850246 RepID=UPI0018D4D9B7|nr:DDE-type integrase/transposase/recombinase [Urechidicola croceus]
MKPQKGHAYLALVTDAYSKRIMGYKIDKHMRTSLCTDALAMAIKNRKYPTQKLIHHSDRGFNIVTRSIPNLPKAITLQ